jgi:hypothetical protein
MEMMLGCVFPEDLRHYLFSMAEHAVSSLVRTQQVQQHRELLHLLGELANREFAKVMR